MDMVRYQIVRRGECKRCGQCCDKSKAQPRFWEKAQPTDDPDVRVFTRLDGSPYVAPRACESLEHCDEGTQCRIWKDRPEVCRRFPKDPCDLVRIENCGYYFEIRCVE